MVLRFSYIEKTIAEMKLIQNAIMNKNAVVVSLSDIDSIDKNRIAIIKRQGVYSNSISWTDDKITHSVFFEKIRPIIYIMMITIA